jgi:hypothetical protein
MSDREVEQGGMSVAGVVRKQRALESPEERKQRLLKEAQAKKDEAAADEAAVDRRIRQNIERYGP